MIEQLLKITRKMSALTIAEILSALEKLNKSNYAIAICFPNNSTEFYVFNTVEKLIQFLVKNEINNIEDLNIEYDKNYICSSEVNVYLSSIKRRKVIQEILKQFSNE